jgi:hypothetical protein
VFVVMAAMLCVLAFITQKLSLSDTAFGIGALLIMVIAPLADRTDFYPWPEDRSED